MKLNDTTSGTKNVLSFNLIKMLGLEALPESEQNEVLEKVQKLVLDYFLQEKVGEKLTKAEIEELMSKYPPESEENVQGFLAEVAEKIPNVAQLYMDAAVEVKARLIEDQYLAKKEQYTQLLTEIKDGEKKKIVVDELARCQANLDAIHDNKWELVEAINSLPVLDEA